MPFCIPVTTLTTPVSTGKKLRAAPTGILTKISHCLLTEKNCQGNRIHPVPHEHVHFGEPSESDHLKVCFSSYYQSVCRVNYSRRSVSEMASSLMVGIATSHVTRLIEFPVLIAMRAIPLAGVVVPLVFKAYRNPILAKGPQILL